MVHKAKAAVEFDAAVASVDYLVSELLEDRHYCKLSEHFSGRWDRNQSLHAAMKLMEQYGVRLPPEDQMRLSSLGEDQMIEALVSRMPVQSKEQFQDFFLQLQLVVSTATQIRAGLRDGRPDVVEAALDGAEGGGVTKDLLNMAMVQAGTEAMKLKEGHAVWAKDSQCRLSKLLRGQEDKLQAQRRLAAARANLAHSRAAHNEKSRKVLMGFAAASGKALMKSTFLAWSEEAKCSKAENLIYEEYRQRIERAEQKFLETQERQLKAVRKMMVSKALESDSLLVAECFAAFQLELAQSKAAGVSREQYHEMEQRLQNMSDAQSARAKNIIQSVFGCMDADFLATCWQAWVGGVRLTQKDRDLEKRVEVAKRRIGKLKDKRKEVARGVFDKMMRASDTGMSHMVFHSWVQFCEEERRSNQMAKILRDANNRLVDFGRWNKSNAGTAMQRAVHHIHMMLSLHILCNWRLHTKMEDLLRQQQGKIESKKVQLGKVQTMFRCFATELESNLKSSIDTDRDWMNTQRRSRLGKPDNSVSLPNIHARQGGSAVPKSPSRSPKAPSKSPKSKADR